LLVGKLITSNSNLQHPTKPPTSNIQLPILYCSMSYLKQLYETVAWLKDRGITPDTGVVLGTGLHGLLEHIAVTATIPYSGIPHFPVSTVESHKGNLVYGSIGSRKVLLMQGRFHYYEGHSMQQVVYPIRVMKLLGVQQLLITNAAGGINPALKKGDLALITDHINLQSNNPLTGQNIDELGPRFPDMSRPYNAGMMQSLKKKADELSVTLKDGVYAAVNGPNLETRAEYRYLKIIGADMVGMSTVPEVIVANHMQLPCAAVSVITDECDPDNLQPVNIEEIIAVAGKADVILSKLVGGWMLEVGG
jgi:purine-nucleoside phosphorylase